MVVSSRSCLNCGAELQGPFCHACGQKDQHRRIPLKHLFHDVLHELWHFDSKVLGTLWLLIRRPGFLTAEYLEGHRVSHIPPFRLYVVISFITFTLLAFEGAGGKVKLKAGSAPQPSAQAQVKGPTSSPAQEAQAKESAWSRELNRRAQLAVQHPEATKKAFLGGLSKAMFLLMPLFAAMLFLLHARRGGSFFVDHMVLSLHFHTVLFLVILGLEALSRLPDSGWTCLPVLALFLAPLLWLSLALQRLHQRGMVRSALKAMLLLGGYGLLVGTTLLGVLYLSLPH